MAIKIESVRRKAQAFVEAAFAQDDARTPEERRERGAALRERVPIESHAEWAPGDDRPDPVALLSIARSP